MIPKVKAVATFQDQSKVIDMTIINLTCDSSLTGFQNSWVGKLCLSTSQQATLHRLSS